MNTKVFFIQFTIGLLGVLIAAYNIWGREVSVEDTRNLARVILIIGIALIVTSPFTGKVTKRKKSRPTESKLVTEKPHHRDISCPKCGGRRITKREHHVWRQKELSRYDCDNCGHSFYL